MHRPYGVGVVPLAVVVLLVSVHVSFRPANASYVSVSPDGETDADFRPTPRFTTASDQPTQGVGSAGSGSGASNRGFGALMWHHGRQMADSVAQSTLESRQEALEAVSVILRAVMPEGWAPRHPTPKPDRTKQWWQEPRAEAAFLPPRPVPVSSTASASSSSAHQHRLLQSIVPHTHGANCSGVGAAVNVSGLEFQCDGTDVTEAVFDAILGVQEFGGEGAIQILEDVLPEDFDFGSILPEDTGISVNISIFPDALRDTIMEDLNLTDPNAEVDLGELFRDQNLNVTELLDDIPEQDIDDLLAEVACDEVTTSEAQCACPLDFTGDECQHRRPFTCDVDIGDDAYRQCAAANGGPDASSAGYNTLDSGDPPCLFFDRGTDLVSVPVSVKCRFVDGPPGARCNGSLIDTDFIDDQAALQNVTVADLPGSAPYYNFGCVETRFVYAVGGLGEPLALSELPAPLTVHFRPWNFHKLSDNSLAQSLPVPTADLVSGAVVTATLPVDSVVGSKFLAGGRVYSEVKLTSGSTSSDDIPEFVAPNIQAVVADQSDYEEPLRSTINVPLLVGLLLGLVLPAVLLAAWYLRRRWKRREEESTAVRGGAYAQMGDK